MTESFDSLILAVRVGKHTDKLIEELVVTTEGYERVLPPEILHYIGKDKTQRLELDLVRLNVLPHNNLTHNLTQLNQFIIP
jgi:hypothetical protein